MNIHNLHENHGNSRNITNSAGPKPPAPPQGMPKHKARIEYVSFQGCWGGAEFTGFIGNHRNAIEMLKSAKINENTPKHPRKPYFSGASRHFNKGGGAGRRGNAFTLVLLQGVKLFNKVGVFVTLHTVPSNSAYYIRKSNNWVDSKRFYVHTGRDTLFTAGSI